MSTLPFQVVIRGAILPHMSNGCEKIYDFSSLRDGAHFNVSFKPPGCASVSEKQRDTEIR